MEEFRHPDDRASRLVGAFGYDLLFQFDPIELKLPRGGRKDLHLFLCDDICFMDRKKEQIERYQYDFECDGALDSWPAARRRERCPAAAGAAPAPIVSDHTPRRVHGECGDGPRRA